MTFSDSIVVHFKFYFLLGIRDFRFIFNVVIEL